MLSGALAREALLIVLGIETAGPRGGVTLLVGDQPPRTTHIESARSLGAELAPAIQRLLREAGVLGRGPDLIGVDLGPGSYTSLRIGLAAAKGIAFASGCPLLGISSTDAMARQAPTAERVLCAIDASRGEVHAALYASVGAAQVGQLYETATVRTQLLDRPTLVVGDAAPGLADGTAGITAADPELAWPTAVTIARIALERHMRGEYQDALRLSPTYFRPNEAEEKRRKRGMRKKGR